MSCYTRASDPRRLMGQSQRNLVGARQAGGARVEAARRRFGLFVGGRRVALVTEANRMEVLFSSQIFNDIGKKLRCVEMRLVSPIKMWMIILAGLGVGYPDGQVFEGGRRR